MNDKLELKNITVFSGAPVMYNLLLKYLKKEDYNKLSNVRLWLSGGAPLPEKISNEFELISQKKIVENNLDTNNLLFSMSFFKYRAFNSNSLYKEPLNSTMH